MGDGVAVGGGGVEEVVRRAKRRASWSIGDNVRVAAVEAGETPGRESLSECRIGDCTWRVAAGQRSRCGRRGRRGRSDQLRTPNEAIVSARVHTGLEPTLALCGNVRDVYAAADADAGFYAGLERGRDDGGFVVDVAVDAVVEAVDAEGLAAGCVGCAVCLGAGEGA